MKLKAIAEACLWLPGFAPEEDPIAVHGEAGQRNAKILPFQSPDVSKKQVKSEAQAKPIWPRLDASVFTGLAGDVTKFEANLAAIKLLRKLEQDDRQPTAEERVTLNRYTGWGGLPQAFNLEQKDAAWVARAERLKALLNEREYAAAHASTPNAHYTSLEIIEAMWAAVQRLGFKGGRILEPAAGIGYFVGAMPEEITRTSKTTVVELDRITAKFLKALYEPFGVAVANSGFEEVRFPDGYFDLAISNVPFGNYQVPELRNVPYANFLIHDYFFAKALDVVRPGGLVVFITSSGTLDKHDERVRNYLASKANLVAAIRLPNTAFKRIANTEVTTDIVILQKPLAGRGDRKGWTRSVALPESSPIYGVDYRWSRHEAIYANQHFAENPQWVIGKLKLVDSSYGKSTGCVFDGDIADALKDRVARLPEGIYSTYEQNLESGNVVRLSLTQEHRPGYRVIDGKVYEVVGSEAVLVSAPRKTLDRIAGMVEIRDAARKLITAQAVHDDDTIVGVYRVALNVAYDGFLARHGYLHAKVNKSAFRGDPDLPLLLSLERWDAETQTAEKADIFDRRTVWVSKRVERCETPEDALTACLAEHGRIVPSVVGELLGYTGDAAELGCAVAMSRLEGEGLVYHDPDSGEWETADAYLSGNVRIKLAAARFAGPRYERNVTALEAVIPSDLMPSEIGARIGSTWIPTSDYDAFLNELTECSDNRVTFSQQAGAWNIDPDYRARYSVAATQTFGTGRVNALTLFEQALNQTVPTVYDPDPHDSDKRVVNQKETIAAREKQQQLKERLVEWLWGEGVRAQRLARLYNDQFNSVVQRRYDGDHLKLPGFSRVYQLHGHQGDAIWRVMASGRNTLLAHAVGAGKTLEMICAGMELRRVGKATKPLYVVPNHMLEQFAAEFLRAYPGANLLMASKEDLAGDKRRHLLSRIATCDWDGVMVTHASFERLKMSDEFMEEYIQNEIDLIEDAIRATSKDRGNLNETVYVFRYVTQGSFDAYIWQTLETKARFIAQVMQGNTGMRSAEDVELAALSYAEVKALASGNPLVMEKAGVDTELAKLALLKSQWEQQQWRNKMELANLPGRIHVIKERVARFEADLANRKDISGKHFLMEVDGKVCVEREEAGKAILIAVHGLKRGGERVIGRLSGFDVVVRRPEYRAQYETSEMLIRGEADYPVSNAESPAGQMKVLENALHRMDKALDTEREHLAMTEKRLADLTVEVAKPYDKAERLAWLQQRQKEINAVLDLTKGEMTAVEEAEALEAA